MDAIGMDLQLSDRASEEYNAADEVSKASETQGQSYSDSSSGKTVSSSYQISSDLATGTTVPVSDYVSPRDEKWSKPSNSSTSSNSSNESRTIGSSLYAPEYLTPSISYDRQTPTQLLIAVIGRAFDQPEKLASSLQERVKKIPNTEIPVAKFTPFTVKRKTLCRGNFESGELKRHDLICMCYNASEARILITGQDGYYTALLRQTELLMGSNKISFLITNYTPPHNTPYPDPRELSERNLLSPALRSRLSLQPALATYLERGQVLSWIDAPVDRHVQRLVEIARLEPNPQGILGICSVM